MIVHLGVGVSLGRTGLLLCQMMWLAQGWGGRVGPCVAPDNPNPAREEDGIKWAPELAGRVLKGPGRLWGERHHRCTKGPPRPRKCVALGKSLPHSAPRGPVHTRRDWWLFSFPTWLMGVPLGTSSESGAHIQ